MPIIAFTNLKLLRFVFLGFGFGLFKQQRIMQSNPGLKNSSSNMLQTLLQIQPQLGIKNNQVPIPFSNANAHLSNGHGGAMPNMPPSMIAQPNFMGVPNNLHPMQSNHLGMPQFGSVGPTSQPGQPQVGFFGSQNNAHSMNSVASFPLHGQFCNLVQNVNQAVSSQPPGQLLGHNLLNLPQQINQNMGLPYGQFCLPNPLQNMNQFVQMQMHNPSQLGPNYAFAGLNQAPQATVSQNSPFFATHQFGNVHSNQAGQQVNQNQQNSVLPAKQGTQVALFLPCVYLNLYSFLKTYYMNISHISTFLFHLFKLRKKKT